MASNQFTTLDRRSVLKGIAAVSLASIFSSCGDGEPDASSTTAEGAASTSDAASAAAPQQRTTLRLPGPNVNFPSPFSYLGGIGYLQASYIYDTLLWKDADGKQIPWLAETWERSDDNLTLTFRMRDGVRWHDGEALTASDVAFTYDYLRTHAKSLAPSVIARPPFDSIESVTAPDATTVVFQLNQPDWTVEQFAGAGSIFIFPEHVWASVDDPGSVSDPAMLVGSGPWKLAEFEPGTGANLYVANDDFFLGPPSVERIEHHPVADALVALQAGEVDQAGGVGPGTGLRPKAIEPFVDDPDYRVFSTPGHTLTALYFEPSAHPAFADPAFRRAIAQGVNRQGLVDQLFEGAAPVGSPGLLPTNHVDYVEVADYAFDVEAARTALDDAGYAQDDDGNRLDKEGNLLRFELLISTMQPDGPVQLVVSDLEELGLQITPTAVDLPTFHQRRNSGQAQLSINTFGGTNTDESPLNKVFNSASKALQRARGYENAEVDRLLAEHGAEADPGRRRDLAGEVQRIVADELPLLPLFYPPLTTIVRTDAFDGWRFTPGGVGGLVPSVNDKHSFVFGGEA